MSHQIYGRGYNSDGHYHERTKICRLENGSERIYHLAASIDNDPGKVYDLHKFTYMGVGTIHQVGNTPYNNDTKYHFYVRNGR